MPKLDCHQSFERGRRERLTRPLPYGRYKLIELKSHLQGCKDELGRISHVVRGHAHPHTLLSCTGWDKGHWMKGLPANVAYRLGRDLLPGLQAMLGEEVAPDAIARVTSELGALVPTVLCELEAVRSNLSQSVVFEYRQMRMGNPRLEPLLGRCIDLADTALDAAMTHTLDCVR